MKHLRSFFLILVISLFILSTSHATPTDDSQILKQKIINKMSFPVGASQGVVHAIFSITESGKMYIYDVESNNPILEKYVLKKLRSISIPGEWDTQEIFNLNFVFKQES